MFSPKVIFAVEILLQLELRGKEASAGRGQGADIASYLAPGTMRRTMSLSVLRRLAQAGLIARTTKNRYVLLREPQGITLLELVRLFHNDLCIGEAYDHYHTFGRENYPSKHYRALMGLEKHMYEKWCGELAATTLARLKNAEAGAKRIREFTEDALPAQCG